MIPPLFTIMTPPEAEERWGLKPGTIRASCLRGPLKKYIERGHVRKSGKTWLVTERAMKETYGNPKEEFEMRKFEELVKYFAEIELDDATHATSKDDFENDEHFYLENVNKDSYEQFIKDQLSESEKDDYNVVELWNAIKEYIQDRVDTIG